MALVRHEEVQYTEWDGFLPYEGLEFSTAEHIQAMKGRRVSWFLRSNILRRWVTGALAILMLVTACQDQRAYKKVSLSVTEEATPRSTHVPATPQTPLRVAVAAVISPQGTIQSYSPLMDYLSEKMGRPIELVQRRTYAEINELIKTGKVELAFVCTGAYVEGQRDFGMELLVAPQVHGQTVYYSYIIVPSDSPAQSLADLRGRVFAFTDPMSHTGHKAALYMLQQIGETPDSLFRKYIFTYSHDNSIKAVAEKLVDGAAVDSLVYDFVVARNPEYGQRTRIIQRSSPYGIPPVVVHPALNPELKARLKAILLDMHNSQEGQHILAALDIDRFVVVDDSAYDTARQVLEATEKQP